MYFAFKKKIMFVFFIIQSIGVFNGACNIVQSVNSGVQKVFNYLGGVDSESLLKKLRERVKFPSEYYLQLVQDALEEPAKTVEYLVEREVYYNTFEARWNAHVSKIMELTETLNNAKKQVQTISKELEDAESTAEIIKKDQKDAQEKAKKDSKIAYEIERKEFENELLRIGSAMGDEAVRKDSLKLKIETDKRKRILNILSRRLSENPSVPVVIACLKRYQEDICDTPVHEYEYAQDIIRDLNDALFKGKGALYYRKTFNALFHKNLSSRYRFLNKHEKELSQAFHAFAEWAAGLAARVLKRDQEWARLSDEKRNDFIKNEKTGLLRFLKYAYERVGDVDQAIFKEIKNWHDLLASNKFKNLLVVWTDKGGFWYLGGKKRGKVGI